MERWLFAGAVNAFIAVAAGAFGAHALKARLTAERLAVFDTGTRYHLVHAVALVVVGFLVHHKPGTLADAAGWLLLAGMILFSGSLYWLALGGPRWLGPITPLGGLSFLAGWLCFALASIRS